MNIPIDLQNASILTDADQNSIIKESQFLDLTSDKYSKSQTNYYNNIEINYRLVEDYYLLKDVKIVEIKITDFGRFVILYLDTSNNKDIRHHIDIVEVQNGNVVLLDTTDDFVDSFGHPYKNDLLYPFLNKITIKNEEQIELPFDPNDPLYSEIETKVKISQVFPLHLRSRYSIIYRSKGSTQAGKKNLVVQTYQIRDGRLRCFDDNGLRFSSYEHTSNGGDDLFDNVFPYDHEFKVSSPFGAPYPNGNTFAGIIKLNNINSILTSLGNGFVTFVTGSSSLYTGMSIRYQNVLTFQWPVVESYFGSAGISQKVIHYISDTSSFTYDIDNPIYRVSIICSYIPSLGTSIYSYLYSTIGRYDVQDSVFISTGFIKSLPTRSSVFYGKPYKVFSKNTTFYSDLQIRSTFPSLILGPIGNNVNTGSIFSHAWFASDSTSVANRPQATGTWPNITISYPESIVNKYYNPNSTYYYKSCSKEYSDHIINRPVTGSTGTVILGTKATGAIANIANVSETSRITANEWNQLISLNMTSLQHQGNLTNGNNDMGSYSASVLNGEYTSFNMNGCKINSGFDDVDIISTSYIEYSSPTVPNNLSCYLSYKFYVSSDEICLINTGEDQVFNSISYKNIAKHYISRIRSGLYYVTNAAIPFYITETKDQALLRMYDYTPWRGLPLQSGSGTYTPRRFAIENNATFNQNLNNLMIGEFNPIFTGYMNGSTSNLAIIMAESAAIFSIRSKRFIGVNATTLYQVDTAPDSHSLYRFIDGLYISKDTTSNPELVTQNILYQGLIYDGSLAGMRGIDIFLEFNDNIQYSSVAKSSEGSIVLNELNSQVYGSYYDYNVIPNEGELATLYSVRYFITDSDYFRDTGSGQDVAGIVQTLKRINSKVGLDYVSYSDKFIFLYSQYDDQLYIIDGSMEKQKFLNLSKFSKSTLLNGIYSSYDDCLYLIFDNDDDTVEVVMIDSDRKISNHRSDFRGTITLSTIQSNEGIIFELKNEFGEIKHLNYTLKKKDDDSQTIVPFYIRSAFTNINESSFDECSITRCDFRLVQLNKPYIDNTIEINALSKRSEFISSESKILTIPKELFEKSDGFYSSHVDFNQSVGQSVAIEIKSNDKIFLSDLELNIEPAKGRAYTQKVISEDVY